MTQIKTKDGNIIAIGTCIDGTIEIRINDTYANVTTKQAKRVCEVVGAQVEKIEKGKTK